MKLATLFLLCCGLAMGQTAVIPQVPSHLFDEADKDDVADFMVSTEPDCYYYCAYWSKDGNRAGSCAPTPGTIRESFDGGKTWRPLQLKLNWRCHGFHASKRNWAHEFGRIDQ